MLPCVTYKLCVTDGRCHWDGNLNAKLSFSFPPAQHISASVCWCWAKKIPVFHMCRRSWRQNAKAPDHLVHYETLSQHDSDFMDLCLAVKVPLPVRCRSSGQPEWLVLGVCESLSLNGFSNILSPGCKDMSSGVFRGKVSQNIQVFVHSERVPHITCEMCLAKKTRGRKSRHFNRGSPAVLQNFGYPMYFHYRPADTLKQGFGRIIL